MNLSNPFTAVKDAALKTIYLESDSERVKIVTQYYLLVSQFQSIKLFKKKNLNIKKVLILTVSSRLFENVHSITF